MTLDRSTYEAWLLDRLEGNLTPEQERELEAFLAANPDLPATVEGLPAVQADTSAFLAKELLQKHFPPVGAPDATRLTDFLIARLEGTLSSEQEQQLARYLYDHPETAREAQLVAATRTPGASDLFPAKESVRRHFPPHGLPDRHRLTDFLIAAEEGDLDIAQRAALDDYLEQHPAARREQRSVRLTRVAATPVVFAGKERLKKREARVIALWPRLAAAASVLLLIGVAWWLLRGDAENGTNIARNEHPVTPSPKVPAPVETVAPDVRQGTEEERPAQEVHTSGASSPEQPHARSRQNVEHPQERQRTPAIEHPVAPRPAPEPLPEPSLAQVPPVRSEQPSASAPAEQLAHVPAASTAGGQTLGTLVANAVRGEVLEEPKRPAVLDGADALAAVDKGLSALTGGHGGVEVQRTGARERLQVRLGRHLAITASRGR